MLLLQRKVGESIYIGDDIKITVLDANHRQVRLGIQAPRDVAVHREEIYERIQREQASGNSLKREATDNESGQNDSGTQDRRRDSRNRAVHPFRRNVQHRNQD